MSRLIYLGSQPVLLLTLGYRYAGIRNTACDFNEIGRTSLAHKSFIEIQTACETAVGNALASGDANVEAELQAGCDVIQAILDRP